VNLTIAIPDNEYNRMDKFFNECTKDTNFKGLIADNLWNMPVFFNAFYQLFIKRDLKYSKKLFKNAFDRSECPKGCYQLLCSIYIQLYIELAIKSLKAP